MFSKTTRNHLLNLDHKCELAKPFNGRVQVSEAEHKALQRALKQVLASGRVLTDEQKAMCARLALKVA